MVGGGGGAGGGVWVGGFLVSEANTNKQSEVRIKTFLYSQNDKTVNTRNISECILCYNNDVEMQTSHTKPQTN